MSSSERFMMLSILIPTYNYDCTELVHSLCVQATGIGVDFEIIVADDASTEPAVIRGLARIATMEHCHLLRGTTNVGRAAIRNRLVREAHGEWLLFMDSDGGLCTSDFLQHYMDAATSGTVVCGSILHPEQCPSADRSLRWRYEKAAERRYTAALRNVHPYDSFRTFNFLAPKSVMEAAPFDENFKRYGYEDVLLGKRLQELGIPILHIDNPLLNLDIETNERFLLKTEEANETLNAFYPQLRNHSTLIRWYERLHSVGLAGVIGFTWRCLAPLLCCQLLSNRPSLRLFNVYKLGHFCELRHCRK